MLNSNQPSSTHQNVYSTDSDYRSEFTNISSLNTYPYGNYINDYNTVYSNEQYRPLSAIELNETQLDALEKSELQNQDVKYVHLEEPNFHSQAANHVPPEALVSPVQVDQYKPHQYANETKNEYQSIQPHQPPTYLQSESAERGNDYVVNTPYMPDQAKKDKNLLARFCGQLFSIILVIFMLLLSFLLIRSFQSGLTASYIARHNQNEWRKQDK